MGALRQADHRLRHRDGRGRGACGQDGRHPRHYRFELLETLAEHAAAIIIDEFKVPWCRLKVDKQGAVRQARHVGVIIERGRKG